MTPPPDTKWPRLLALSVHEFRTPVTVVAGYIRMLLKDRAGAITDQQRRLLEEAEKSCGRLSAIISEMSDLSNLEAQTAPINRSPLDLHALLADTIAGLPEVPDRAITVALASAVGPHIVHADPVRLKTALTAIFTALRRELVTSSELVVRETAGDYGGHPGVWVAIADAEHIEGLASHAPETLATFDEWRGGCGLSLAVARRVVDAHGGAMWSPADGTKAGAVLALPQA